MVGGHLLRGNIELTNWLQGDRRLGDRAKFILLNLIQFQPWSFDISPDLTAYGTFPSQGEA